MQQKRIRFPSRHATKLWHHVVLAGFGESRAFGDASLGSAVTMRNHS